MNINELLTKGNLTTIATWLYMAFGSYICAYITQEQFTTLIIIVGGVLLAVYSSKNPNTLKILGNGSQPVATKEPILNDEYVTGDADDC